MGDINKSTFLAYEDKGISLKSGRIDFTALTPLFKVSQVKGQSITEVPSLKLFTDEGEKKADKINQDGKKVVYTDTGEVTIPENVVTYVGSTIEDIYPENKYKVEYSKYSDNNGKIIPSSSINAILPSILLKANTKYVVKTTGSQTMAASCIFHPTAVNTVNAALLLPPSNVDGVLYNFTTGTTNLYMTICIKQGTAWDMINTLQVLESAAVEEPTTIVVGNTEIPVARILNSIYTKEGGNVDVSAKAKAKINYNNNTYVNESTGKLIPYNNTGQGLVIQFVDLYEVLAGETVIVESVQGGNTASLSKLFVFDSAQVLVQTFMLSTGSFVLKASSDVYLRFYTYYNGGTTQPTLRYDIRDSLKVYKSEKNTVVIDGVEHEGDIAFGTEVLSKEVPLSITTAYIDRAVDNASGTGGKFIKWTSNNAKSILNAEPLEEDSDYVLDLGKNNQFPFKMYGFLFDSVPYNVSLDITTGVKAVVKLNVCMRRYIYFSTKDMPSVKYIGLQVAGDNFSTGAIDFASKVKLRKIPNGKKLRFGKIVMDSASIRNDYSDCVEPVNVPFPKWIDINLIGRNIEVIDKYNRVDMICEYADSNGNYFKVPSGIARQGTSTVNAAKMPLKGKMTTNFGDKFNLKWGKSFARASHHFKSFPFDCTGLLQQTMYSLVYDYLYKSNPYDKRYPNSKPYDPSVTDYRQRFNNEPMFIPYGVATRMFMNGCFWGIYFMSHADFCENYGIFESDANAFVYKGKGYFNTLNLAATTDDWEEIKTDTFQKPDPLEGGTLWSDDTKQPLVNLNNWLVNSNDVTYKAEFTQHFDLNWQIDYFLACYFLDASDSFVNNNVLITYDRTKFYSGFRDGDAWAGFGPNYIVRPYNSDTVTPWSTSSKLWGRFYAAFSAEVNARYAQLRKSGVFSLETVETILNNVDQFSYEQRLQDLTQWEYVHTDSTKLRSSIGQILNFIDNRIKLYLDDKFSYSE